MDGDEVEFSEGFADLHTRSYESILAGHGYGLSDVRPCIEVVSAFRSKALTTAGDRHPYVEQLFEVLER